ncbi:MAG: ABC transporter transmembrane domain-containing protein, partial [Bacteroidia bacterium]
MLCVFVSFLDGIGLAMFMPLLQAVGDSGEASTENDNLGKLGFVTDIITNVGFTLNINTILGTLILVFIIKGVLKYFQLSYQVNLRTLFMKRIRYKLVEDLQGLSYSGFLKFDAGTIQNTLISEVQRLFQTMNFYFAAAQAVVMLATYLALAFLANYQFAILVAVGAGLTNFFYRRIYFATKRVSRQLSTQGHDFNGFLIQAIQHFKYLKATNYFRKFETKLKRVIDNTEELNKKMGNLNAITTSMKEPMIVIVVTLVILLQISIMGANLSSILLSLLLFYRALGFLVTVQNHWQNFLH